MRFALRRRAPLTRRRSRRWIEDHRGDPFVRKAREQGYRSRAAYKLQEIAGRDRLLRSGQLVLDLGAAPGGWSQIAASRVAPRGRVVAVDLLPMDPIPGVLIVQGDFRDAGTRSRLREALDGGRADLILSDMAPNLEGVRSADAAMSLSIATSVFEAAAEWLAPGGALLVKVFEGPEVSTLRRSMTQAFVSVRVRKPEASRARSSEIYLMAKGFGL